MPITCADSRIWSSLQAFTLSKEITTMEFERFWSGFMESGLVSSSSLEGVSCPENEGDGRCESDLGSKGCGEVCKGKANAIENEQRRLEEIPMLYRNLPIFMLDQKLRVYILEEFGLRGFAELFRFLNAVLKNRHRKNFWNKITIPYISRARNRAKAKKKLWKTILESLPPPTLKDSLSSCKVFISKASGKLVRNNHPEWPKKRFFNLPDVLVNDVVSRLGECEVEPGVLFHALPVCGKSVIGNKYVDEERKFYISVADFFKEYPNYFPWRNNEIRIEPEPVL